MEKVHLNSDLYRIETSQGNIYLCPNCNVKYTKPSSRSCHMRKCCPNISFGTKKRTHYECSICGHVSNTYFKSKYHYKKHNKENK